MAKSDHRDRRTQARLEILENLSRDIGSMIGPRFNQAGACFALLGFTKGVGGWSTWVSNAHRDDMIKALREMADVLEVEGDTAPLHGQGLGPGHKGGEAN